MVPFTPADLLQVPARSVDAAVADLVREALGVEAVPGARLEPVAYVTGSPATAALARLVGTDDHGRPWSLFVKVLQHVRHWPGLAQLPPPVREHFVATFLWRCELDLWDDDVQATLPTGLRAATLHRLVELPDDRVALWLEDVAEDPTPWTLERYADAARLLGRWNARSTGPDVLAGCELPPGTALRLYAEQAVPARGLAPLADDALWRHPWLADHADLRADLQRLGGDIAAMLDRLDSYLQCVPHGDASPQNLLPLATGHARFAVIDISFRSPHALGFDLGQLLVGLTHAGLVPAADLAAIADTVEAAYLDGLHDEGVLDQDDAARDAFATATLLRSGFDGFLYDTVGEDAGDPAVRRAFAERVAMSRLVVDRYLALHPHHPTHLTTRS